MACRSDPHAIGDRGFRSWRGRGRNTLTRPGPPLQAKRDAPVMTRTIADERGLWLPPRNWVSDRTLTYLQLLSTLDTGSFGMGGQLGSGRKADVIRPAAQIIPNDLSAHFHHVGGTISQNRRISATAPDIGLCHTLDGARSAARRNIRYRAGSELTVLHCSDIGAARAMDFRLASGRTALARADDSYRAP